LRASHVSSTGTHSSDSEGDPWQVQDSQAHSMSAATAPAVSVPSQFYELGGPDVEKQVCF
jgi:hypothetical protein